MTSWTPGGEPPDSPYGAAPYSPPPQWGPPQQPYAPYAAVPPQWHPGQPYGYPGMSPVTGLPPFGPGSPASMGNRLLARILDSLIVGVPAAILIGIVAAVTVRASTLTYDPTTGTYDYTAGSGGGVLVVLYLLVFLAVVGYEVYLTGVKGATIGKRVMGIRVQDTTTGQPIGIGRGVLRYLVLAVTGSICLLGYLSPFFDSSKRLQGWHDKAANDLVVSTR